MHFDQREQAALRAAGLTTDEIGDVSDAVAASARREARRLETFFDRDVVYSDADRAHSSGDVHEHALEFVDLFTHADEIRGYVRFDSWGAWVTDGRVLRPADAVPASEAPFDAGDANDGGRGEAEDGGRSPADAGEPAELVELTLGPTVHDRVRFAADPEEL